MSCPGNSQASSMCNSVLGELKKLDPNAAILPGIGCPTQANGQVCTLTHQLPVNGHIHPMTIQGYTSKSPLANNALYSFECPVDQNGQVTDASKCLNLYEVMLPDVPTAGQPATSNVPWTAQQYVNNLHSRGMNVAGVHVHWMSSSPKNMTAVHHQQTMNPMGFVAQTGQALAIAQQQFAAIENQQQQLPNCAAGQCSNPNCSCGPNCPCGSGCKC